MIIDFMHLQQKRNQKQELRELLQRLLHANRNGNTGAVARIALDIEYVIDKL
jgi:hypothetical protein